MGMPTNHCAMHDVLTDVPCITGAFTLSGSWPCGERVSGPGGLVQAARVPAPLPPARDALESGARQAMSLKAEGWQHLELRGWLP